VLSLSRPLHHPDRFRLPPLRLRSGEQLLMVMADLLPRFLLLLPLRWIEDSVVAVARRLKDPRRRTTLGIAPELALM
jgi:hypothetical protein